MSAGLNYLVNVAESIAATDNQTYTVDATATPTGVLLTISLTNVNVWGEINDGSSPNWVQIKD